MNKTREELLQGVDFKVGMRPTFTEWEGKAVAIPKRFATLRYDTGEPLGVVGSRYKVHQHADTIIKTAQVIDNFTQNYDVTNKVEGARVYTRFTLNDVTMLDNVSKEQSILAVDLLNSHDGSRMVQLAMSVWRQVCSNGMHAFVQEKSLKKRHVKSVSIETLFSSLPSLISVYKDTYTNMYNKLANEKPLGKEIIAETFNERLIKKVRVAYVEERNITNNDSAWTQYQAFTRTITHEKFQENRKLELNKTLAVLFTNQFNLAQ